MASIEDNTAAVNGFFAVAGHGDLDALDALVSPGYVMHDPSAPEDVRGLDGAKAFVKGYRDALGPLRVTIDHQFAHGDYVATRFTARGRHEGELMGVPATGADVTITGLCISRCSDGKVAEEWEIVDQVGLMRQIGALPELAAS